MPTLLAFAPVECLDPARDQAWVTVANGLAANLGDRHDAPRSPTGKNFSCLVDLVRVDSAQGKRYAFLLANLADGVAGDTLDYIVIR